MITYYCRCNLSFAVLRVIRKLHRRTQSVANNPLSEVSARNKLIELDVSLGGLPAQESADGCCRQC